MADLLDKLTAAVRTGTIGAETRRSAQWFRDKIKGIKGDLRNRFHLLMLQNFIEKQRTKLILM